MTRGGSGVTGATGVVATRRWHLVLPVKGGESAKSRLGGAPGARRALALAMARDAVAVALQTSRVGSVCVVTADPDVGRAARTDGASVVTPVATVPPGTTPLDAAVLDGVRWARARAATGDAVAVLLADVPALRAEDLAAALQAAGDALPSSPHGAFVADADGSGTVLLAVPPVGPVRTGFGTGSAARHEQLGLRRLDVDAPTLRRDVDTPADLRRAEDLGVGPRTSAALRDAGHGCRAAPSACGCR